MVTAPFKLVSSTASSLSQIAPSRTRQTCLAASPAHDVIMPSGPEIEISRIVLYMPIHPRRVKAVQRVSGAVC
jgi:hypothetical protein